MPTKPHIAVIGAGAFGGWTALYLLRGGARVTLLDAWGPGNSRSSSGGETRVIRGAYGPDQPYTKLAARALELWKEHEAAVEAQILLPYRRPVDGRRRRRIRARLASLRSKTPEFRSEQLSASELARRWPQINFENVEWGIYEPQSGYLLARASAQAVVDQFIAEGGEYRQAAVAAHDLDNGRWKRTASSPMAQRLLTTATFLLAVLGWASCFRTPSARIFVSTKQDVFFFGTPAGDPRYNEGNVPVWADHSDHFMYGIPGNQGRGFKMADDTRGAEFDPTTRPAAGQ